MYERNPKEFLQRLVTVDKTWIHHYTPEMKEQSKQWVLPAERAQKNAKTLPSVGNVMDTVFWNSQGFIDCLEDANTITGEYYAALFVTNI